jgi:hypothetical protein
MNDLIGGSMFRATILSILWLCLMTDVIVELPADNAPLVQALADSVRAHYYLADTGAQVADALLALLRGGEYDAFPIRRPLACACGTTCLRWQKIAI